MEDLRFGKMRCSSETFLACFNPTVHADVSQYRVYLLPTARFKLILSVCKIRKALKILHFIF